MDNIKMGDRVRVKDRADWPSPPGYRLAKAEGTVVKYVEDEEVLGEFKQYVHVKLERADGEGNVYIGNSMCFRLENLEKI